MTFVVDFSRSASAVLRPVPVAAVTLAGSFWGPRLQRNVDVTLPSQYALLESTRRKLFSRPVLSSRAYWDG